MTAEPSPLPAGVAWSSPQEWPLNGASILPFDLRDEGLRMIQFRREQSADFNDGVESVIYIRCMEHREVPQFNRNEIRGAECAACEVSRWAMAVMKMLSKIGTAHALTALCGDCFGELRDMVAAIPQDEARTDG